MLEIDEQKSWVPPGDAVARSPLDAVLDRNEGTQVLDAARIALHRTDPAEWHRALARSLASSPIASRAFARFPTQMAELCIEALRSGSETVCEPLRLHSRASSPKLGRHAPTWPFKVFVLGRFQMLKGDVPVRFARRQQRKPLELLQALIAFGGTEVGAAKLIDALWPDSEGDAGYHALETTLYRLRQLLGIAGVVSMAGGKLTLDGRQVWVDAWAFERELRAVNADGRAPFERLARLRDLYSGDLLEQEAEKTWAVERRENLRARFVRTIGEFARSYEERGLWQEAARTYQLGIEVNSLAEEFHRGLIVCYRELGDHGAAVMAYRRCSELLLTSLGVRPSSKTLALYQSVTHPERSQAVSRSRPKRKSSLA